MAAQWLTSPTASQQTIRRIKRQMMIRFIAARESAVLLVAMREATNFVALY
jgi:hypothetical protein